MHQALTAASGPTGRFYLVQERPFGGPLPTSSAGEDQQENVSGLQRVGPLSDFWSAHVPPHESAVAAGDAPKHSSPRVGSASPNGR